MKKTLGLRLVAALLLAFALISVLVIAMNYWNARTELDKQSTAAPLTSVLIKSLDALDDAEDATAVLQAFIAELNRVRQEVVPGSANVSVRLERHGGGTVYESGRDLRNQAAPTGLSRLDIDGHPHVAYSAQGQRWNLLVLEPLLTDLELLEWLLGEVGMSLLIALPVLLLTLWLAVRSGLRPLRQFSQRIEALDTRRDLQPLGADLRYAELQPLGRAFDALLARLREHLALERAFVHDAAHGLRTPLAALSAQAHVLLGSPDEASRAAAAQALQQGLQRTAHLGQQLLDLSALDPTRSGDAQDIDVCELAAGVLLDAHADAKRRSVTLALEGPESLAWHGEPLPLQSILQNLVDNALRYGATRVELSIEQHQGGIRLAVRDNGPGIAPALCTQVFERFWRGTDHDEPGTGLGLAIVAQAAERLHARLRLDEGLDGRGVGFVLELGGVQPGS